MTEHFDTLETRDPEIRERAQLAQLARQVAHARARAPAFSRLFADVEPGDICSREALAQLPVTRKFSSCPTWKQATCWRRISHSFPKQTQRE